MKKIDLGQAISILANLGVIAGIAFLALELQQNNQLLQEQARSAIVDRIGTFNGAIFENRGELATLLIAARQGQEITDEEALRLATFVDQQFLMMESAHSAYEEGIIEASDLNPDGWSFVFHEMMPRMPEYWAEYKSYYRPSFVQWMEENVVSER